MPTIDRDAAQSAKGPRLQRLRVALFLLEAIAERANIQAYAAVEAHGDAFISTATEHGRNAYTEEDKNYKKEDSFTIVSDPIINSIVLFVDQWINWHFSDAFRFGLYTTANTAKERFGGRVKDLNLTLPASPILDLLSKNDYSDPNLLPCVIAIILDEYKRQYSKFEIQGHLLMISNWPESKWKNFLSRISWLFSKDDDNESEIKLIDAIKTCRHYTELHEGKEKIIAATILDTLDTKQLAHDFADRFIHASEIELIFKQVASGEIKSIDPTWKTWEKIPAPTDQRTVSEKLISVCPALSATDIKRYQRSTAAGHAEFDEHSQDKNVLAMRFHIFDACERAIAESKFVMHSITAEELSRELERITNIALERISERSVEYGYTYKTKSFIYGLVLNLFDSCFLAFDSDEQ